MLRGILVLTFVSCCWAGCCMPKQWEGLQNVIGQSVTSGKAAAFLVTNVISYDGTNSRVALIMNSTAGSVQTVIRVIHNYNKGIQYNIDLLTNKCTKSKIVGSIIPACVPDNAVKGQSVYFGGGKNRLPGDTYFWNQKAPSVNVDIGLTVSPDGTECYPVGEVATGTANTARVFETVGFLNITKGINDPSVFTPPPSCNQVPITEGTFKRRYRFLGL
ncbi:mammalian ependymin-related protein 1-like [Haliotis rubra]|uniref:mammalian ependymin-related protein 1-like n=1 Tax=Haliotis rubra TaxID=36100 RepID=UPI001EE5B9BA|nr:mammalian ependymin-related protein 1-like [Haliotis rubra]